MVHNISYIQGRDKPLTFEALEPRVMFVRSPCTKIEHVEFDQGNSSQGHPSPGNKDRSTAEAQDCESWHQLLMGGDQNAWA